MNAVKPGSPGNEIFLLDYQTNALHGRAEQAQADATRMNMEGERIMQPVVLDMVLLIAIGDGRTHCVVPLAKDRHTEVE